MLGLARASTVHHYKNLYAQVAIERNELINRLLVQRDQADLTAARTKIRNLELENGKLRVAAKVLALRPTDV